MLVVRAIKANDLDGLFNLASQVGTGMTTLKPDMKMMGDRVAVAVASFAETIPPEERDYMFVMEDTDTGRLAGVCAIKGAVGLTEPFYNYRIGTLVHSSRELNVFTRMDTLYLSNDLTGCSELCSLFLHPDYRQGNNGKLLSKSRFLFIAQFPHLFEQKIIAEMRGYQAEDGSSPFYEGLGRHFFKMDFHHVDDLTALGKKSFIEHAREVWLAADSSKFNRPAMVELARLSQIDRLFTDMPPPERSNTSRRMVSGGLLRLVSTTSVVALTRTRS